MLTYDKYTIDSTGAFLIGELERLDQTLHEPLYNVTWGRDIDLREDVSIADEVSSFTNSSFGTPGTPNPKGKNWIGKNSNAIAGPELDIGKTSSPLYLWGIEISYTIPELLSAQQMGRPVDAQKYQAMQIKYQMDIDEMVYIGDTDLGKYGLLNSDQVTSASVATGDSGTTEWTTKTADEILEDVNSLLQSCWEAAAYAVCPSKLLLPPAQFAYITSQKVSNAGNISILQFLEDNSISLKINGKKLDIQPCKWLTGCGTPAGSPEVATDRMVCYSQDKNRVRYPLVPLQRTPLEYRSIYHLTTYFGRLGVMEIVYPETLYYADGI
ncbi:MAG: DUF2184 domain-containing protein [Candidatus Omnitrophota bacterium]